MSKQFWIQELKRHRISVFLLLLFIIGCFLYGWTVPILLNLVIVSFGGIFILYDTFREHPLVFMGYVLLLIYIVNFTR